MSEEQKPADEAKLSRDQSSASDRLAEMIMKGLAGGGLGAVVGLFTASDLPQKMLATGIGAAGGAALTFVKPIGKQLDQELEEGGQAIATVLRKVFDLSTTSATGFEKKYLEALKTYCYDLSIEGFKGDLPSLALDDVFVPLRLDSDPMGRANANAIKRIWDLLPKVQPQESDRHYRRLAIIGDPGHGKTTLMKYLTLSFTTDRYKAENAKHLFPVLLLFRSLYSEIQSETSPDLPDLIVKSIKGLPKCGELQPTTVWVQDKLKQREVLVMLDGLDEVPESRRELVSRWANRQMQEYDTSFILTSRPHGYEDADLFTGVQRVNILDFTIDQKREFLEKWYAVVMWRQKWETIYRESLRKPETEQLTEESARAQSEEDAKNAAIDLMRQITGNFSLNRLSSNPLLVTVIAATHRAFEALPDRRAKLYQKIFNLLLEDRPNRRSTHLTLRSAGDNQVILQGLALALTQAGKTQFTMQEGIALIKDRLAEKSGETNLTPAAFLREIQTIAGLLVGGESDLYQFSHKTFQEFLSAIELKEQDQGHQLITQLQQPEGVKGWEEVISFYCAIVGADTLVEATVTRPSVEALKLMRRAVIEEKSSIKPAIRKQLEQTLEQWASVLSPIATLEFKFRQMRRLDEKTELTLEPIPEETIDWLKQEQQAGQSEGQEFDHRSFCLWLTTLPGLQVEGKLFTYRLPTALEKQQINLVQESDLYIVRQEIHLRYEKLLNYLTSEQWEEADLETTRIMLEVAGQTERGYLDQDDLKNFSCEDLLTIDRLWVEASNGHFGFSVQKKIWEECGSSKDSGKNWNRFCVKVGWKNSDASAYVSYTDLKKNPSLSPMGELPMREVRFLQRFSFIYYCCILFSRAATCEL
jgi:GUN4-like/NACHT domain